MRVLRRADGGRVQDRRDVLAARQGDDDEGVAPHRLRARGARSSTRTPSPSTASCSTNWASTSTTAWSTSTTRSSELPRSQRDEIMRDLHACHEHRPELAMVDSAKGISNFHSPNDVIVDASMPAMIRAGGKMWGADGRHEGHQGGESRVHVRPHLPGDDQLLQDQRRLRSGDDGHRAQRRPDGAAGRGIRLARQDLRDSRGRRGQHRRPRHRRSAADAERRTRRHLAHVQGQGRGDPRLGQAGRHPRPQLRACRRCSGWTRTVRTRTN